MSFCLPLCQPPISRSICCFVLRWHWQQAEPRAQHAGKRSTWACSAAAFDVAAEGEGCACSTLLVPKLRPIKAVRVRGCKTDNAAAASVAPPQCLQIARSRYRTSQTETLGESLRSFVSRQSPPVDRYHWLSATSAADVGV